MEDTIVFSLITIATSLLILVIKKKTGWLDLSSVKKTLHTTWQIPLITYVLLQAMEILLDGRFIPFLNDGYGLLMAAFIFGVLFLWGSTIYANVMERLVLNKVTNTFVKYLLFGVIVFPIVRVLIPISGELF